MSTTNFGNQILSFDYSQDITGRLFNLVNYKITPSGIYEGFALTKLSNSLVSIATGLCVIYDSVNRVSVRIETTTAQNLSVSNSTPFIVFRMQWADAPNCFMDMLAVSNDDIEDGDIIIGRCVFDNAGTTLSATFDYTRKSIFYLDKFRAQNSYLQVTPTEPRSNKIIVSSAKLNSSKGNLSIAGGTFPTSGIASTVNGRIDIVYIDETGAVKITTGVDASSPVAPRYGNKKVIAEIRRGASRSDISGAEIFQVNTSLDVPPITSDQLITDSGNYYSADNVEGALQEIAGNTFTFAGIKTFNAQQNINAQTSQVGQIIKGASAQDIQQLKKSTGDIVQRVDSNGKLINTVGCQIAITDTGNVFTTDQVESALNQLGNGTMTIHGSKTFDGGVNCSNGLSTNSLSATNASITSLSADTVNTTSALAKKKNIKLFTGDGLGIINSTKIVEYTYIDDPDQLVHTGFIADFTSEKLSGPNHDQMVISDTIGILLKAVQQLSEKIDVLQRLD
jgi:hypothetical protein